jgi:hypothetical protein
VCVNFRALGDLRSFWTPVLARTRQEKPLNWPSCQSLLECTADKLRAIAFHRLRLDHNWSRPSPTIYGPVKFIHTHAQQLVAVVPATDIIVVYSSNQGRVVCYDTRTGQQTFQLDVPINSTVTSFSGPFQIPGQYHVALRTNRYGSLK